MRGRAGPPHPGMYRVPSPGFLEAHDDKNPLNAGQFHVLKKCHVKFDRLVYKMLWIKKLRPNLNTQRDCP